MENKYRILFFKYLCIILNLPKYEKELEKNNIVAIDNEKFMCYEEILCSKYSKYFYLLNKISIEYLNKEEREYLSKLDENDEIDSSITSFLLNTYKKVMFKNAKCINIYYGPHNDNYLGKDTQLILGLKREELGFFSRKIKKQQEIVEQEKILDSIIDKIKEKSIYDIKIIKYNELYEKNRKPYFIKRGD